MSVEGRMEGHLDPSVSRTLKYRCREDLLSTTVLLLPVVLLFDRSNQVSALLLSFESPLLTTGLVLDGEPLEGSVCVLLLFLDEGGLCCNKDTERCATGLRGWGGRR